MRHTASIVRWTSVAAMAADDTIRLRRCASQGVPSGRPTSGFSQLTIQGMPKRSVHMPKRCAQKVGPNGMVTVPSCGEAPEDALGLGAAPRRAARTLKPCGVW